MFRAEQKLTGQAQNHFRWVGNSTVPRARTFTTMMANYYLMTAEGGTGYEHVVTMARSRNIEGPYEVDPAGPVVTAYDSPDHPLQRNGHGDLVRTRR